MSSEQLYNTYLRQHIKSILLGSIDDAKFHDVAFNVGMSEDTKKFYGFKSFFAIQSNKWHELLYNNNKLNKDVDMKQEEDCLELPLGEENEIQITNLNPDTFAFLQKLFYGASEIRINRELVISLMKASKLYNIDHLWNACYQYILTINFSTCTSSFFYLLYETQRHELERECIQIVDLLKPIENISEFEQFFNQQNQSILSKICIDIVIYLLFLSNKFDSIPQEFKWKVCVSWTVNDKDNKPQHRNDTDPLQYEGKHDVNMRMKSMCAVSDYLLNFKLDWNYFGNENADDRELEIDHDSKSNEKLVQQDFRSKLGQFVPFFVFTTMDWAFFIENVYSLEVLTNDTVIYILCDYVLKHAQFMLSTDRKKRFFLPTTKFINYIKEQKQFVLNTQKNTEDGDDGMGEKDIILQLVEFIQFNTNNIENKKKSTRYSAVDAAFERKRVKRRSSNCIPFLYTGDSKQKYSQNASDQVSKRCDSRDIGSLYPKLCESVENKLEKLSNRPLLNDVRFRLNCDKSLHFGIRALFALHSKVFDSMLFSRMFVESSKQTEVYLDNINGETFKILQRILLGLQSGPITRQNIVGIYCFSDTYLMIDIRSFALKFICCINIDSGTKAADFIDIIATLHEYQSSAFWNLFIAQIYEDGVTCSQKECDYLVDHFKFAKLSKDIIKPFVFESNLFAVYSQEMLWKTIVKWASSQFKANLFLQNALQPFLEFFNLYKVNYNKLSGKEFLILLNNAKYKRIFEIIKAKKWPLKHCKNVLENALFKSLSFEIVDHIVMNLNVYHNVHEELLWSACVKWCMALKNNQKLSGKLKPFLKHFLFSTMSIVYFEWNVVPHNVLTEYEIYSVYERFCDFHGVAATINSQNAVRLCLGASKHSLRKLQRHCLSVVASMNISNECSRFLTIMKQLYESKKINNFTKQMSTLFAKRRWSNSECWTVANNAHFELLPLELVKLVIFEANQFGEFSEAQLWQICVKWCDVNSNYANQRNKKLREFVCYFNFNNMTISFFRANVENLNVLTDSEIMKINQNYVTHLLDVVRQKNETIKQQKGVIASQEYKIKEIQSIISIQQFVQKIITSVVWKMIFEILKLKYPDCEIKCLY